MKKFGGEKLQERDFLSIIIQLPIQISFKHTIVIQAKIIQSVQLKHITMKEEDLSAIKRYPIVEYLDKERHQACQTDTCLCSVPLTAS